MCVFSMNSKMARLILMTCVKKRFILLFIIMTLIVIYILFVSMLSKYIICLLSYHYNYNISTSPAVYLRSSKSPRNLTHDRNKIQLLITVITAKYGKKNSLVRSLQVKQQYKRDLQYNFLFYNFLLSVVFNKIIY